MKNKLKLYFGKQPDEVEALVHTVDEEIKEAIKEAIITEEDLEKPKTGKLEESTINLIFVDDKIVEEASEKVLLQSKKASDRFVSSLDFGEWKIPDVETAFSAIDQTIEEQFQKSREKAMIEVGLDPEIKQQQRMRIESEFRERRRKRMEQQSKKGVKKLILGEKAIPLAIETGLLAEAPSSILGDVKTEAYVGVEIEESADVKTEAYVGVEIEESADVKTEESADVGIEESADEEIKESADVKTEESADVKTEESADVKTQELAEVKTQETQESALSNVHYTELFGIENDGAVLEEPAASFATSNLDKGIDKIFEGVKFCGQKILKGEGKLEDSAAKGIDKIDSAIGKLEIRIGRHELSVKRNIFAIEHYFEKNKKKAAFSAAISVIGILIITFAVGNFTAYEYMYNGKILGIVKNQEEVYKTIDVIGDKLIYEHNAEIKIDKDKDISFNRILAVGKDIDDKEDILNRLTYMKDITAKGYAIIINGQQAAILANEEEARDLLAQVKMRDISASDTESFESIGFEETVLIESVDTKLGSIESQEKVATKLFAATTHKGKNSNKALLNIQTEQVITYTETVPFTIAYEDTMTKYKGETTVKSKGAEGQQQIIAKIVKTNGKEVEREILKETKMSEPVAQVVLRGAKEPPKLVGTGTFIYPIRGTISSRFGYRWGDFHQALDIAAAAGTPIKASDGGTVIFSGWKNSYGNIVIIDHGGNRSTKYAHCSKLLVEEGQKVFQGMEIALVGSTGNSTGPHVHFEVLINNVPKNPLGYL